MIGQFSVLPTIWSQKLQLYIYRPLHSSSHQVCTLLVGEVFVVGGFKYSSYTKDKTSTLIHMVSTSYMFLDSQWIRGAKDNGHYNAFNQFIMEKMSRSNYMILSGLNRLCQNFT